MTSLLNHGFKCKHCNEFIGEIHDNMTGTPIDMFIAHLIVHKPGDFLYIEKL